MLGALAVGGHRQLTRPSLQPLAVLGWLPLDFGAVAAPAAAADAASLGLLDAVDSAQHIARQETLAFQLATWLVAL